MTPPAGPKQPAFDLPNEIMIMIWQEMAKYLTDNKLYNFRFDIVRNPLGLMACFTPVHITAQLRDLVALLAVNKTLRKWAIRALGGRLLPINYITWAIQPSCPPTTTTTTTTSRRNKVLRQGLVPFNLHTSLFCITSLTQNFELWFRGCGPTDKAADSPWTRDSLMAQLTGFDELARLVKNLVFPMQRDRWKFSTLYEQDWESLIGPAGGALPIAFARRFNQLERMGMVNERKAWSARAEEEQLPLVKSVKQTSLESVEADDIPHVCFTLWIEWWAWDAGFELALDPTEDLEAAICQLLGKGRI